MSAVELDLREALAARGALLEGHFRLSSGRHSDRFVQKFRILEDPTLLEPIGRAIAERFRALAPSVVVSAAVGGILLGYEVARNLGVKAIFVEKENGVAVLRRGFSVSAADRVLVVEDVLTTGLSVREVIELVRRTGAQIAGVGVIVNRGEADFTAVLSERSESKGQDDKVPVYALLDLPLHSYAQAECPQCRAGEPIRDPGSRRA
ncbi:MAG TPA: orotate phosphoribosyltransferase [Candidatus Cybelea sp.]|jgi:orotate phosphoribosyltransferase|nr:orotate phosphoribosyltransferase [Candidatus Cybelea sp.]